MNLPHIEARMKQSGHWQGAPLNREILHQLLIEKFQSAEVDKAAEEVQPFLKDPRETQLWSPIRPVAAWERLG